MICNVCNTEIVDKDKSVRSGRFRWHLLCYADKQVDNDAVNGGPYNTASPYWGYMNDTPPELMAAKQRLHYVDHTPEFPDANPDVLSEEANLWRSDDDTRGKLLEPLQRAFNTFSEQERKILLMVYHEGLNQEQMAKRLKVSQPRVNQIIMGIRKRMEEIGYKPTPEKDSLYEEDENE